MNTLFYFMMYDYEEFQKVDTTPGDQKRCSFAIGIFPYQGGSSRLNQKKLRYHIRSLVGGSFGRNDRLLKGRFGQQSLVWQTNLRDCFCGGWSAFCMDCCIYSKEEASAHGKELIGLCKIGCCASEGYSDAAISTNAAVS